MQHHIDGALYATIYHRAVAGPEELRALPVVLLDASSTDPLQPDARRTPAGALFIDVRTSSVRNHPGFDCPTPGHGTSGLSAVDSTTTSSCCGRPGHSATPIGATSGPASDTPCPPRVWAVTAVGKTGPFEPSRAVRLTDDQLYAGRLVRDPNDQWVLLAFPNNDGNGNFAGGLSDPMPVDLRDGVLRYATPRRSDRPRAAALPDQQPRRTVASP